MGWKLLAISVFCFASFAVDTNGEVLDGKEKCSNNFIGIAGKCYKFHQTSTNWMNARSTCESEGAHLASVNSEEEYKKLLQHMNAHYGGQYWLSGATVMGSWIWTSEGTKVNPSYWGRNPNTKDDSCAYFCSKTNKYWDAACTKDYRFVCEIKPKTICSTVDAEVQIPNRVKDF